MFANALKSVSVYTYPVIISQRLYDGKVKCDCATFIILNEEGWILTSAHVLTALGMCQGDGSSDNKKCKKKTEEKNVKL